MALCNLCDFTCPDAEMGLMIAHLREAHPEESKGLTVVEGWDDVEIEYEVES